MIKLFVSHFTLDVPKDCAMKLNEIGVPPRDGYVNDDFSLANKNDIMVEILGNDIFQISRERPLWTYRESSLSNYKAICSIKDETATITIKLKKGVYVFFIIWYIFVGLNCGYLFFKEDFAGLLWVFLLIISPIGFYREKGKYKKFIVDFLTDL